MLAMLVIMRTSQIDSEPISWPPLKGQVWWWIGAAFVFAILVGWGCFHQGLNWDEPWILNQARLLANRQATEPFKPLAGLLAMPFVHMEEPWMAMRLTALLLQAALAWVLWRLLAKDFERTWRWLAIALLWLEPTFRERALEMRTDIPALITVGIAILIWRNEWPRIHPEYTCLPLMIGLGLAPKTVLWIVSWVSLIAIRDWGSGSFWKQVLITFGMTAVGFILLWSGVALWTHRHPLELFLASGQQNHQALSREVWFPPQAWFYLLQTLRSGWPYYALVSIGLALGRVNTWSLRTQDLVGSSVVPWLLVPVYAGAFPYHFVGLIPPLLPAAVRGLQVLARRFGHFGIILPLVACVLAALVALSPVCSGPGLQEQVEVLRLAKGYLQPGQGYVDGVGMLPRPQSAFFVTGLTANSNAASRLVERWEHERVSVFILNGRTEQLLRAERLDWVQRHFVQVHPNLLVLGKVVTGEKELSFTWCPPWEATFMFSGTAGWTWTLNGHEIRSGTEVRLTAAGARILGSGPGHGQAVLALAPPRRVFAPPIVPYFLPFQRP